MRIIPVCHSNGYCCLFVRIPLRILYAGIPRAWRRPWRMLHDRLDETKGSDCSKRGVSDSREHVFIHPCSFTSILPLAGCCVQWARIQGCGMRRGDTTSCQEEERTCKITRRSLGARELARIPRERSRYAAHHPLSMMCLVLDLSLSREINARIPRSTLWNTMVIHNTVIYNTVYYTEKILY